MDVAPHWHGNPPIIGFASNVEVDMALFMPDDSVLEAVTKWSVLSGILTIFIHMAGPGNGISTQTVERRASCSW